MKDWPKVKLGDLLTESKIASESPDARRRIKVKLNVGGVEHRPENDEKLGATKYFIRKARQFIYGKQNLHKGAFGIIPIELDGFESSSDLPCFDVYDSCYPEWIYYFFKQGNFYSRLSSLARGIGSKRIQPEQLYSLSIPLPDKKEQKRILDLIYDLEQSHSSVLTEISKQTVLTKKLIQVILDESLSGKLTESWREKATESESAKDLIVKIRFERAKNAKTTIVKKRGKPRTAKTNIPKGWVWCYFNEYGFCERGRFSARPRNDPRYYRGSYPFIQIGDLPPNGGLITEHKQTLNDLGLTVSKIFPQNTVVIAIVGGTIGNTGILTYDVCFPDSLIGIKPTDLTNYRFIEYFLRSKKEYFRAKSYSGGGQPNIKLSTINDTLLLLPPLKEQQVIVEKIDSMVTFCEKLINNLEAQRTYITDFIPAILSPLWETDDTPLNLPLINKTKVMINTFNRLLNTLDDFEKGDQTSGLIELLKTHGRMSAVSLWQMSKFHDNIDLFYDELKKKIETKLIKESSEKGYLELTK